MKILIIHNNYSQQGGEESVVAFQQKLLEENQHQVYLYVRDYNEMKHWWFGRIGGTFSALYNPRSIRDLKKIITKFQPEAAILHNLFPIISPAIIPFLKKNKVRTIQILHNYRLLCPIGIFYTKNQICEKCTGKGREWHCLLNRCNGGSLFKSLSYTIRNIVARKFNYFGTIEKFVALSNFQKNKLVLNAFDKSKITVIPNSFFPNFVENTDFSKRDFIGFVGRLDREKGIFDFIQLADLMPEYQFRVAGKQTKVLENVTVPENLKFVGLLDAIQLRDFYTRSKVIIFPSRLYEGFPMTLLEAFSNKTPVITYNLSVMPEIVENGKEGFVVDIGDIYTMRERIEILFQEEKLWTEISENAREKFMNQYNTQSYYLQLMSVINSKT